MAADQTLQEDAWGPLNPAWVPDTPADTGTPVTTVPTTELYADPLSGKMRGVAVDQGTPNWLKLYMAHPQTGGPLTFSVGSYSTPPLVEVRYREAVGIANCMYVPEEGDEPSLAADGTYLLLPLPTEVRDGPGVYRAQTRVVRGDGKEMAREEFWVYVQRGFWVTDGSAPTDQGPPTLQEVRTALRDHPAANRLLGEYEFDAIEVSKALVLAVQHYNSTHPVGGKNLDTRTWPTMWRGNWMDGVRWNLFETAAAYCRRGTLPYTAGGMSVNDLAKEKDYLTAAELYRRRFQDWCVVEKVRQSVASAWGSQGSGLPSWRAW